MLNVYTAQYGYKGEGRIDITVKSSTEPWNIFAPRWQMVNCYKKGNKDVIAEAIYTVQYEDIIANAFATHGNELMDLIYSDHKIVLVCFCKAGDFCHRVLLAKHFEALGAIYHGEL